MSFLCWCSNKMFSSFQLTVALVLPLTLLPITTVMGAVQKWPTFREISSGLTAQNFCAEMTSKLCAQTISLNHARSTFHVSIVWVLNKKVSCSPESRTISNFSLSPSYTLEAARIVSWTDSWQMRNSSYLNRIVCMYKHDFFVCGERALLPVKCDRSRVEWLKFPHPQQNHGSTSRLLGAMWN